MKFYQGWSFNFKRPISLPTLVMSVLAIALTMVSLTMSGCDGGTPDSQTVQRQAQEKLEQQSNSAVGMPAIVNFREKRQLKGIYELRDQTGLVTWTYTRNAMTGKWVLFCQSEGYPIPYATQYTNPQEASWHGTESRYITLPQADPNGLYSPADAEGTWVVCKDPTSDKVGTVYVEDRVTAWPFPMSPAMVQK